jgi:putative acetyltransferase
MPLSMQYIPARFPQDREALAALFREYEEYLGINLSFQSFAEEIDALPGKYAPPEGGILLARDGDVLLGCVCWYPLKAGIAEIKRLYIRPAARGRGAGRTLLTTAIRAIAESGYETVYLDSLKRLEEATALYESLGFKPIMPYNTNPHPDVYYLALSLKESA